MADRERLWNAVEAAEKRKDARLARETQLALPRELDREAQLALLRGFVGRADGGARHGRGLRGPRRAGPRRRPAAARARDDHHPRDRPDEAARLRRQGPRVGRQGPGAGVARGLGRARQRAPSSARRIAGARRPPHARGAAARGGGGRRLRARGRARPRAGAEGRLGGVGARAQGRRDRARRHAARGAGAQRGAARGLRRGGGGGRAGKALFLEARERAGDALEAFEVVGQDGLRQGEGVDHGHRRRAARAGARRAARRACPPA